MMPINNPAIVAQKAPDRIDLNRNRSQNPLWLFRPVFPKPNMNSWNPETTFESGYISFKMTDSDGESSMEADDIVLC